MSLPRRLATAAAVVALTAGAVFAARPAPTAVETGAVTREHLEATLDVEGRTRVRDRYVVSATTAGNLRRPELRPGDAVEAGAVVAAMLPVDPTPLDARARTESEGRVRLAEAALRQAGSAVERSRDALTFARNDEARTRSLVASGAMAPHDLTVAEFATRSRADELASAQFAARGAEYELANARALLSRSTGAMRVDDEITLRSPVRGRVLRVLQPSGGVVAAGAALLEVGDTEALEVVVDLLTADAAQVSPGATAHLEGTGLDHALTAHVRRVEPSAFTRVSALGVEEQRVNALLDLHDPPTRWRGLGDGWRVEARIVVWEADAVTTVPLGALVRSSGVWTVFVVEGGRARRRVVGLGHHGGDRVEVLRGVRAGETVVLHPSDRLRDGDRVTAE